MNDLLRGVLLGAAAGAAGTTALNAATYLDMAVRGRPSSSTPEQTVEALAETAHVPIPGEGDTRENRLAGLGPLTGILSGVASGVVLGLARAAGWRPDPVVGGLAATALAMVGGNGPMTVLGVTDPRTWPASSWIADVVPHLAYGLTTAVVLEELDPS